MAQALHGETVDVADAGIGEVVDSRFVGVNDAVTVGDGDGVACDLVDGLQPILELACELLRLLVACLAAQDGEGRVLNARDGRTLARVAAQDVRLLTDEHAQERGVIRVLDVLVEAALEQDQRVILLVHRIGLLVAGQVAEEALAVLKPRDGVLEWRRQFLMKVAVHRICVEEDAHEPDDLAILVEGPFVACGAARLG